MLVESRHSIQPTLLLEKSNNISLVGSAGAVKRIQKAVNPTMREAVPATAMHEIPAENESAKERRKTNLK